MFLDWVKEFCGDKNTFVSFDMDGVLAEYKLDYTDRHNKAEKGFYRDCRPIQYVIDVAKQLAECKNITVGVLSQCAHDIQAKEKVEWLERFAPFVKKENIKILTYSNLNLVGDEKEKLKCQYLKELKDKYDCVFHIDDDVRILKQSKKFKEIMMFHISSVIN